MPAARLPLDRPQGPALDQVARRDERHGKLGRITTTAAALISPESGMLEANDSPGVMSACGRAPEMIGSRAEEIAMAQNGATAKKMRLLGHNDLGGFGNCGEGMAIQLARDGRRVLWLGHESAPKNFTAVDVSDRESPRSSSRPICPTATCAPTTWTSWAIFLWSLTRRPASA